MDGFIYLAAVTFLQYFVSSQEDKQPIYLPLPVVYNLMELMERNTEEPETKPNALVS